MDQVSRPLVIAFAATIAFVAIWFVALRPKPVAVDDTPLAPIQAIDKARDASAVSDAANAQVQAATGQDPSAAPVAGDPTAANAVPITPSKPSSTPLPKASSRQEAAVLRDIGRGKVVVLLFWNAKGADDVATRGALRGLDRRGGKVAVHIVPIARVGSYESITKGVSISQSPTILVIDRKRRARTIVGLSEPSEIKQAVGDALAGRGR